MSATVKCIITLPDAIEPLVLGIHTIDARNGDPKVDGSTLTITRDGVVIVDGYIVYIILYGNPGYILPMNILIDDVQDNTDPITPIYKPSSGAYVFLYESN